MNEIDIIIVARNGAQMTLDCIASIYKHKKNIDVHIILVDNCSEDDTVNLVKENYPEVKIIKNLENYGYAKAVNIGFENSSSEHVIISNNDVLFHESTLKPLIETLNSDSTIGITGPQQLDRNGNKGLSYGDLPGYMSGIKYALFLDTLSSVCTKVIEKSGYSTARRKREVGHIDGGFMMIRRTAFVSVGGFDEDYFFYTEEADFCYLLKKNGWKVVFDPASQVTHFRGGVSESGGFSKSGIEMLISSKALYCRKNLNRTGSLFFLKAMKLRFRIWLLLHKILPEISILNKFMENEEIHKHFYQQLKIEIKKLK